MNDWLPVLMEEEDISRHKDAEIAALREEIAHVRVVLEAAKREGELLFEAARLATKENVELRKRLQSWADDADELIARARRAELEALEL